MRSWHALKPMNEDLRRKQLTVVASTYGYPVILRTQSLNKPRYGNHYYLIVDLRARSEVFDERYDLDKIQCLILPPYALCSSPCVSSFLFISSL
ncbi:hypothetical protein Tcan_03558 [Toxocara canis]|uniref:Uncharacterized protein n=1 Tax=Toxocara canis TaxID=6265 RepID=A0A0B2VPT3_TOXCA|nr:hypothetical protein Tcan_03558 [Toxocara canis]